MEFGVTFGLVFTAGAVVAATTDSETTSTATIVLIILLIGVIFYLYLRPFRANWYIQVLAVLAAVIALAWTYNQYLLYMLIEILVVVAIAVCIGWATGSLVLGACLGLFVGLLVGLEIVEYPAYPQVLLNEQLFISPATRHYLIGPLVGVFLVVVLWDEIIRVRPVSPLEATKGPQAVGFVNDNEAVMANAAIAGQHQ